MFEDRFTIKALRLYGDHCKEMGTKGPFDDREIVRKITARIAQALSEEAEIQFVSEEEIMKLSEECHDVIPETFENYGQTYKRGFKAGFQKAQSMRATEDLKKRWPSEEEIKNSAERINADHFFGFLDGCEWLKEKLGV